MGIASGRLEERGPSGEFHEQTSNRAELRAVIAVLQFRAWYGEGWKRLVIATDSEYVTKGATEWIHTWAKKGWQTSKGTVVKNQDMWMELTNQILKYRQRGMEVIFWRIPRDCNKEADRAAKEGARGEQLQNFTQENGVLC